MAGRRFSLWPGEGPLCGREKVLSVAGRRHARQHSYRSDGTLLLYDVGTHNCHHCYIKTNISHVPPHGSLTFPYMSVNIRGAPSRKNRLSRHVVLLIKTRSLMQQFNRFQKLHQCMTVAAASRVPF